MEVSPEYVAGFFDGEGHVDKLGYPHLTQKDPTILLAIQRQYGGRLRTRMKGTQYRLTMGKRSEARRFFEEVGPHSFRLSGVVPMVNHPSTSAWWKWRYG